MDIRTRTLVMDFCVENDARSLHVLNAVSPAWTCSLPFCQFVVDRIDAAMHPSTQTDTPVEDSPASSGEHH